MTDTAASRAMTPAELYDLIQAESADLYEILARAHTEPGNLLPTHKLRRVFGAPEEPGGTHRLAYRLQQLGLIDVRLIEDPQADPPLAIPLDTPPIGLAFQLTGKAHDVVNHVAALAAAEEDGKPAPTASVEDKQPAAPPQAFQMYVTPRGVHSSDDLPGLEAILSERLRQIDDEGYDSEHDDDHESNGRMADVAAEILADGRWGSDPVDAFGIIRKYGVTGRKPSRLRMLAIAGALCAAEYDRLKRASDRADVPSEPNPAPDEDEQPFDPVEGQLRTSIATMNCNERALIFRLSEHSDTRIAEREPAYGHVHRLMSAAVAEHGITQGGYRLTGIGTELCDRLRQDDVFLAEVLSPKERALLSEIVSAHLRKFHLPPRHHFRTAAASVIAYGLVSETTGGIKPGSHLVFTKRGEAVWALVVGNDAG